MYTEIDVRYTRQFESAVDERRVEHPDGDVFELVSLSGDERGLERDLGERPMAAVKCRVSEVV